MSSARACSRATKNPVWDKAGQRSRDKWGMREVNFEGQLTKKNLTQLTKKKGGAAGKEKKDAARWRGGH